MILLIITIIIITIIIVTIKCRNRCRTLAATNTELPGTYNGPKPANITEKLHLRYRVGFYFINYKPYITFSSAGVATKPLW